MQTDSDFNPSPNNMDQQHSFLDHRGFVSNRGENRIYGDENDDDDDDDQFDRADQDDMDDSDNIADLLKHNIGLQ